MSVYEDLTDRIRSAVDEATLQPLGRETFLAFQNHLIDSTHLHILDRAWNARAVELGVKPPQWWSTWNDRAQQVTREPDVIPLANLRRLDLKLGDRLAVILPAGVVPTRDVHEFAQQVQDQLDECAPDLRAVVFPPGTQLDVVSAEQVES